MDIIFKVLNKWSEDKLDSVGIPPLGTGKLGIPIQVCVDGIKRGIEQYSKKWNKSNMVEEVNICIFDQKTHKKFLDAWNNEDEDVEDNKKSMCSMLSTIVNSKYWLSRAFS